jgi:hypothetical protein
VDQIEKNQSNKDVEASLAFTDELTDEILLRAAATEAGPVTGPRWTGACCGR